MQLYSFFNLSARWRWVANVIPWLVYPQEWPGSQCAEGWLGSRVVRTGVENIVPIRIWSPENPYHYESPYRLSEPGPHRLHHSYWDVHSSGILCSAEWYFPTDISRWPIRLIFKNSFLATWPLNKISEECRSHLHHGWNLNSQTAYTIKVYYSPTNAQVIVLKTILKFTLKQLRHVSVQSHCLQGAHYLCLLNLHFVKMINYGTSACD